MGNRLSTGWGMSLVGDKSDLGKTIYSPTVGGRIEDIVVFLKANIQEYNWECVLGGYSCSLWGSPQTVTECRGVG